jgi:hypothetical protein
VTFRIIVWNSVDSYIHTSGIATTDTNTRILLHFQRQW